MKQIVISSEETEESKRSLSQPSGVPTRTSALFRCAIFFSILLGSFLFMWVASATDKTWNFSTSSDYTFDNTKIEISSGQAQLKATSNWYNTSWGRRKAITIDNTGNSNTLTNYQVQASVTYDSDMQADFDDNRFTDSDGTTLIDHWLETKTDSTSAIFWVEVPSISASSNKTIYMYYGNSGASSASNGDNTFVFFDDFNGSSLDTNKWTAYKQGSVDATVEVSNGALHLAGKPNTISSGNVESVPTFTDNIAINVSRKQLNGANYMDLSLGGGSVRAYDGGSSNWFHTALGSGYYWRLQDATSAATFKMPLSGTEQTLGNPWVPGADLIGNYYNNQFIVSDESSGNIKSSTYSSSNPLVLPYGGASGMLHPNVLYFPNGKDGYMYWMMYTPYPPDSLEVPFIVRSNDGINWTDSGITNPVIPRGGSGAWDEYHIPDPDMIYVPGYDKWFAVHVGSKVSDGSYIDTTVGLAYSNDGKTWNKNGVLIDGVESYEKINGHRWVLQPSIVYENGTFYIWYVTPQNATGAYYNNQNKLSLATFTWNNTTNQVENFQRNAGNPIFNPDADATFKQGLGHVSVSKLGSTYYMYAVREILGSQNYDLALFTSTDKINWTNQGRVLERGGSGWDSQYIYRSKPVIDETGQIVLFNGQVKLYYSGYLYSTPKIGMAYGDGTAFTKGIIPQIYTKTDRSLDTDTDWLTNAKNILISQGEHSSGLGGDQYVDWISVRKYTSPEPSVGGVYPEESLYPTDAPTIQPTADNSLTFTSLSSFIEAATKNGGEIKYQISNNGGTTWYWYNSGWTTTSSGYTEANTATDINTNILSFPTGAGQFIFKAYLNSDGSQLIQLDSIDLTYVNDITPPTTTPLPSGGIYNSTQSVTLTCADNDGGSGCASIHYSINGTDYTTTTSNPTDPISIPVTTTLYFYSVDANGNQEDPPKTETYTIDATLPDTIIDSGPDDPTNSDSATFTFHATETATFQCSLDSDNDYSSCESSITYSDLSDGEHIFYVKAIDGVNNEDPSPAQYSWTIDTTPPQTSIDSHPDDPTNSTSATFHFSADDEDATFDCSLDSDSDYSGCDSGQTYTDLADGEHIFYVRAADEVNNEDPTPASYSWSIDSTATGTTIDSGPDASTIEASASFTFSSDDENASFECSLDDADYTACTSPQDYTSLALGDHTFSVKAIDDLDNEDPSPATFSWTVTETPTPANNDNNERDLNIHSVKAVATQNSITITFKTDHNAKSSVRYGTNKDLKAKKRDNQNEKNHKIVLKDLLSDTVYYFRIKATDGSDNEDSSKIHSIKTLSNPTSENQTVSVSPDGNKTPNQTGTSTSSTNNAAPTACSYTVAPGDTLWSIAKEIYNDPTAYPQIIEKNKDKYPDIESKLSIGEELTFGCTQGNNSDQPQTQPQAQDQIQSQPQPQTKTFIWWNPFTWF